MFDDALPLEDDGPIDRLYTPWRIGYVRGDRKRSDCAFCTMRDSAADTENFVLERGEHAYVVMNLFPYNTGHLLIVPYVHAASPEDLSAAVRHEMADLLPRALRNARLAMNPDAFNVGFNLGSDAGAGIAAHLHEHIVPRWRGDSNFMPIIGSTRVLPEVLPVTFAKLKAEFCRDAERSIALLVYDADRRRILVERDSSGLPSLPTITPVATQPFWKSALETLNSHGLDGSVSAWNDGCDAGPALEIQSDAREPLNDPDSWAPAADMVASRDAE